MLLSLFERVLESGNAYSNMSKLLESLLGAESFAAWTSADVMSFTLVVGFVCIIVLYFYLVYFASLAFDVYDWLTEGAHLELWYQKAFCAILSAVLSGLLFGLMGKIFGSWML